MRLFFIRYFKITFIYLRLHKLFGLFSGLFLNLSYMSKMSKWISKAKKNVAYNDFPSRWNYEKRYEMYKWVLDKEGLREIPVNYMEFGVAQGQSFRWFLQQNHNPDSRFHGFDTFTGLPEDWGPFKKGFFDNKSEVPAVDDKRAQFHQGLFQQTLPGFIQKFENNRRNIFLMDADLYSATLYALTSMAPYFKSGDVIFFDEFAVPTHEFKAYYEFTQSYYIDLELIAAANNYYFAAFKVK